MTVVVPEEAVEFAGKLTSAPLEILEGVLRRYRSEGEFTGAYFEQLVSNVSHPDRFDVVDVVSLWALSVKPTASMIKEITEVVSPAVEADMARWPDRDLAELTAEELAHLNSSPGPEQSYDFPGLGKVWDALIKVDGIGRTRTSKLMAKKRPKLIPIFDSVVESLLGLDGSTEHWRVMHALLTNPSGALTNRLVELSRTDAGAGLSLLRIFDILAWMSGAGYAPEIVEFK